MKPLSRSAIGLTVGFAMLAFLLAFKTVVDLDLWWHLAAGRWIWENKSLISEDPFSFTASGLPWTSITWGYELLIYWIHELFGGESGGMAGVTLLHGLFAAGCASLAWLIFFNLSPERRSRTEILLGVGVFFIGLWLADLRWINRPEMLTHFWGILILFLLTLDRRAAASGGIRWVWIIPLVQLLWVNTHGLFIFGPIMVGAFVVSDWVERKRITRTRLSSVWIATALACLVNPEGLNGALFPFHLYGVLTHPFYQRTIPEATRPFSDPQWAMDAWGLLFWVLLMAGVTLRLKPREAAARYSWGYLLLAVGLVWLSISARRNIALLVVWTLPFLMDAFVSCIKPYVLRWKDQPSLEERGLHLAALLTVGFAVVVATNLYRRPTDVIRFGGKITPAHYPEGAVKFLKSHSLNANTFANVELADYAMFKMRGFRPYIDGRFAELYPLEHFRRYMDILAHPALFDAEAHTRSIEIAALSHRSGISRALIAYLANHPSWMSVYFDEVSAVFVKKDSRSAAGLQSLESPEAFGKLLVKFPRPSERKRKWDINLRYAKYDSVRPFVQLAEIATVMGRLDLASHALSEAMDRNRKYPPLWPNLCRVGYLKCAEVGERTKDPVPGELIAEAEDSCLRAIRIGVEAGASNQVLGLLYMNIGKINDAIQAFDQVVKLDPLSYEGHFMRAQAYSYLGDTQHLSKVIAAYEEAARLRPYEPAPLIQLGLLAMRFNQKSDALKYLSSAHQLRPDPQIQEKIDELLGKAKPRSEGKARGKKNRSRMKSS